MTKAKIYQDKNTGDWVLKLFNKEYKYPSFYAAQTRYTANIQQFIRVNKAIARITNEINPDILETKEVPFIAKLIKTKCSKITKRQYGYLVGICERHKEMMKELKVKK